METSTRGLRDVVRRTALMGSLSFLLPFATIGFIYVGAETVSSQTGRVFRAQDPGVRGGTAAAGGPLAGVTDYENEYFVAGKEDFEEADGVAEGLGPTMNLDSCGGCHSQPAIGGTSPAINPQVAFATDFGGRDAVPPFLSADGPVREARFVRNPMALRMAAFTHCSRSPDATVRAPARFRSRISPRRSRTRM
jgi:hypothetical protein